MDNSNLLIRYQLFERFENLVAFTTARQTFDL